MLAYMTISHSLLSLQEAQRAAKEAKKKETAGGAPAGPAAPAGRDNSWQPIRQILLILLFSYFYKQLQITLDKSTRPQ